MAKALPVLKLNKKSFQVDIDTNAFKSVLAKVGNQRFAFISINGPTRTGKSYLLSHFVRYFESKKKNPKGKNWFDNSGRSEFLWRGGIDRTTTGMDLWSEPYFVKTPQGEKIAVLLLDTQGLFDPETSARDNAIIFSVSTLCSSTMIFNIRGMVEENILQQVEFFSGYAFMTSKYQNQDPKEKTSRARVENDSKCTLGTNILFLLRDFELQSYKLGHQGSKKRSQENDSKRLYRKIFDLEDRQNCPEENRIVRQNILKNFQNVSAYCLPHPGKEFLRTNNLGVNTAPDDDFKDSVIAFVERLVRPENLVTKTVLGVPTTGLEFQKYIDLWANMCKDAQEVFPDVLTVAENTSFIQYSIALNLAVSKYKNDMDTFVRAKAGSGSISNEQFEALHLKLVEAAETIFLKAKMKNNPKFEDKFKLDLTTSIERCYEFAKESNDYYKYIIAHSEFNAKILAEKMQELECQAVESAKEREKMNRIIRGHQLSEKTLRDKNSQLTRDAENQDFERKMEMEKSQMKIEQLVAKNLELTLVDNTTRTVLTALESFNNAVGAYNRTAEVVDTVAGLFTNDQDSKSLREENRRLQNENVTKEKKIQEMYNEIRKLRKDHERLKKGVGGEDNEEIGCKTT